MEEKEQIKDLDKVEPIDYGVVAKPHTPVYKMHRYFARRPYTVFRELIKHYSNPGSIVIDPMCGGGVTIIEGLRLRRKVIGVDINPMAIFITKCEAMDVDLNELKKAFLEIEDAVKEEIENLYLTKCPTCNKETPADWFEWSNVVECPSCKKEVVLAKATKIKAGTYQCPYCPYIIKPLKTKKLKDKMIRLKLRCDCGFKGEKQADDCDFKKYQWIEENFERIVKEKNLWYPKDKIFEGEKTKELLTKGYKYFFELFTKRNLLSLSLLLSKIKDRKDKAVTETLGLVFSSGLYEKSKLSHLKGETVVKPGHHYWLANLFSEVNVWRYVTGRYKPTLRAKLYTEQQIGNYCKFAKHFFDSGDDDTCWLLTKSATDLREIPDASIDAIITDPPYGGNVNYTELSDFWTVWIKDILGMSKGLIDNTEEAIENKYQGKGYKEYRDLMHRIFKECHRVLKPNRWMVMTFHNRNFKVWNAIHLAAHDAGFVWSEKDGMIYQPPIQAYITTLHQQAAGSMLGDFILSYKKAERPPESKLIEEAEIGNKIKKLASESIEYHGGARLSTIYMHIMPFLLNGGLLGKIQEKDLEIYLNRYFVKRDDKWYFAESKIKEADEGFRYAPVEKRLESIIRRFLYDVKSSSTDEVLNVVYSRLINSNAAEYEEIMNVVNRICVKVKKGTREVWELKEERDRGLLLDFLKKGEPVYSMESDHDVLIEQLVKIGKAKGYDSHIGITEQNKDKAFKDMSIPMGNNVQFGLNQIAFDRIRQIDVLWIKGISIIAAFEVEQSRELDSEIGKFRDLFAATQSLKIPAYLVVPDKLEKNAKKKIGSLANRRDGITERIKYILFSDIKGKENVEVDEVAKQAG